MRSGLRRIGIAALVLAAVAAVGYLAFSKVHREIDVGSGREREILALGPLRLWSSESDTDLSRFLGAHGLTSSPPAWHRFHTSSSGARINYRYGGIMESLRGLLMSFEVAKPRVPESEQVRLVGAAMELARRGEWFNVRFGDDPDDIEIVDGEQIVAAYRPHAAP